MVKFILRALVSALGLWVASQFVPGVEVKSWQSVVAAGLLLGLVNALVRPIVTFLTLPLTVLTLGLFLLIVNALMVKIVDWLLGGFNVHGLLAAVLTTIVVWLVSCVANWLLGDDRKERRRRG